MSEITSRVTARGAVTIPEDVRTLLGLEPGSQVAFERTEDGRVVLRKVGGPRRFDDVIGCADTTMTTDEIMRLTRGE
ncbi:MAG: AbrB/MazE/SpoVT family DNA-binding domain-containing protein [Salinarimonas sp.]